MAVTERSIILIPIESQQEILDLFRDLSRLYQAEKSELKDYLNLSRDPKAYLTEKITKTQKEVKDFPQRGWISNRNCAKSTAEHSTILGRKSNS